MKEIITRKSRNIPDGKELFEGISGNFKDFGQTLCELTDNAISNFRAHNIRGFIEIMLVEHDDYVGVTVRDNGTGIEDMDATLTIAARSCAESALNEHGMGLKHALASINAGADQHWSIQTRTAEDAAHDRHQRVESPYSIGMPVYLVPGSGDIVDNTGTVVQVRCPMHKFLTLKPASQKDDLSFAQAASYLCEMLRYTYANLLRDEVFSILFTAVDKTGSSDDAWLAEPLEPIWRNGYTELPPVETDLGGGAVTIFCRYGSIRRSKKNAFYYKGNMASSGAEIRINGRAIQHGLCSEIWGKALHPSQNRFLAQIDILCDQAVALPDTKAAKNGLREDVDAARREFHASKEALDTLQSPCPGLLAGMYVFAKAGRNAKDPVSRMMADMTAMMLRMMIQQVLAEERRRQREEAERRVYESRRSMWDAEKRLKAAGKALSNEDEREEHLRRERARRRDRETEHRLGVRTPRSADKDTQLGE